MQARKTINTILHYFNLDSQIDDYEIIHENIIKDIEFRGTNLWILMFAIIVASIGLNMNSTAVVIGAMLISPLMGPIIGMGYSIATYNFPLLQRSLKNYGFAVGASLTASFLYFLISPISTAHSELLARTSPSIYDVLIAFFGGLAGIVALTSKQKGNVIPGVAIATALMPPLCTAGYSLATAQFNYFFGAMFLFTINTVFIGISSILISQILKFPFRTLVQEERKKQVNKWISIVIIIILLPSLYFGYSLVQKERFQENASLFVKSIDVMGANYLLNHEIRSDRHEIVLVYGGNAITDRDRNRINEQSKIFNLDDANIIIQEGFNFSDVSSKMNENLSLNEEIVKLKSIIQQMENQRDSINQRNEMGKSLLSEINILYPEVTACTFSETVEYKNSDDTEPLAVVVLKASETISAESKERLLNWLRKRLDKNKVHLFIESAEPE
ncbi:DUF389 domain-containing protein [Membranihabitans marinus]|uniref:DUF389 domain-containing protein n=1 Tax=Membranihabitans marinus TaxID=1227546 RepID=UPI001F160C27|nr:DUF389 domain-containing protein [Membranihabitans marinus]